MINIRELSRYVNSSPISSQNSMERGGRSRTQEQAVRRDSLQPLGASLACGMHPRPASDDGTNLLPPRLAVFAVRTNLFLRMESVWL